VSWWVGGNGYLVLCKMWLKWKAKRAIRKKIRKKSKIGLTGVGGLAKMEILRSEGLGI